MNRKKLFLASVGILTVLCCGPKPYVRPKTNEPISKEATLSEVSSPCEWMVIASGIGEGWGKEREAAANTDARKAAVYFVLLGGTDPLLQTSDEKQRYNAIKEELFLEHEYSQFISWENTSYENRVKLPNGNTKIEKFFKVNRCNLKDYLVEKNVLISDQSLRDSLGLPFIMVIPEARPNQACLEMLNSDPLLKTAAQVIESYLTVHGYDALVPEQSVALDENIKNILNLKQYADDESYAIALCIGADIYITYSVSFSSRMVGNTETKQAIVGIRAYETTTARLLGTETGYSEYRPVSDEALIEEAINGAAENVLNRIQGYWKQDIVRGLPYKLLITLDQKFSEDERDYFNLRVSQAIKNICQNFKENIISDYTMDYMVWVSPQKYSAPTEIYQAFKDELADNRYGRKFNRIMSNKKLLLFEIKPQQM
jgi:hypothetical protein